MKQCVMCQRFIRKSNKRAIMLFLRPDDKEVWVCGPECEEAFNEEN